MSIKSVGPAVVALLAMAAWPAAAQDPAQTGTTPKHRITGSYYWQQTKPTDQKPDPKPDAKVETKPATAATMAGKWLVSLTTANGPLESGLEMKADPKDPKKLSGTITSQMGNATHEGEVVDGKLTFWFTMSANGSDVSVTFTGTMQKDGSLAGTLSFGQGEIPWTAVREKK